MAFGFKHGSKNLIRFVAKPTVTGAYTFDNSQKSAVITGYDAKAMTVSGTQQATSSGTYSITFTLNKGYAWEDKSKDAITLRWTIAKRTVSIPTMTNKSFTYAVNSTFAPTISGVNAYITQSGTASATKAGSYSVTWALVYPNDTVWSDNTTSNKSASWSVAKRSITIPSMTNTSHTWAVNTTFKPTITGVDSTYVTQSGATSSTSAGSWTVTWSLKDTANTAWSDNTTGNKTATWSVAKRSITVPSITSGSFTWAVNKTFAPTITGVDSNYITQTGTVSSTNAGSWTVTWALKSTANTQWSDKTTANKTGTWSVAKLTLAVPSISSAKSFSFIEGTTRSVTVSGYNSTYETQSGTASASALGTYTLKWVLKYPANTQWSGGTVTDKTESWSIVWVNGTSHYSNDIYNRGWGSSNLEFKNGSPIWNADSFELDTQNGTFVRTATSFGSGAVFHAMVKWTSGTHGVSVFSIKSDWGTTTASTTNVGESFTEVSGANSGNVTLFNKMGIRNNNSSSYQLVVQRIWKT